jgi:xylulokinase
MPNGHADGPLVAGVDSSTQSTKVVVVDSASGLVVAVARAGHEVHGHGGARESDPRGWWEALRHALSATGRAGEVRAIAVAGQQHGLVTLDAAGRPVRPAVLWNDTRSAPDAEALWAALGGPQVWAERVGSVPVPSFTVTRWAWLRRVEPQSAAATRSIRLPHDYLTERLSGRAVTDRGDASGTGWWSTADERYDERVLDLDAVQLDPAVLPEVLGPLAAPGPVRADVAAELGLPQDCLVGPGTGDNMGAALALGLEPGTPVVSLGTSGTAYAAMHRRAADPTGVVAGFADAAGGFLPLACTLNATLAVDRVAALLGLDREAVEPSGEVVVQPYFDGERTPNLPHAAASFTGLRHDTAPGQVLMAAYEGVVASLLEALERIAAQGSGLAADAPIVLIGGGARGATWRDVVRRLSGRPLVVPEADELVALGAAVQAAAVLEGGDLRAVARRFGLSGGLELEAVERDDETMQKIARVRAATDALNRG